jgi:hypothetical protein
LAKRLEGVKSALLGEEIISKLFGSWDLRIDFAVHM